MVKKILKQLLCILALCAAVLGVFWFNASSASRKTVTVDDIADPDYTEDPSGSENSTVVPNPDKTPDDPPLQGGSDGSQIDGSGSQIEEVDPEKQAYDAFIASLYLSSEANNQGYTKLVYEYGIDTVPVYAVKLSEYTDNLLSERYSIDYIIYRHKTSNSNFVEEYRTKKLPMLFLYGGLLMENRDGVLGILSWHGDYVCSAADYYLTYATDAQGRYLFQKDGVYYYYDEDTGAFVESQKNDYYGVYYDVPPSEMQREGTLVPFQDSETKKWGYVDGNGEVVIKAQYYHAYEFGDNGIAAVKKNKLDGLLFINTSGKVVLDSHLKYYKYNGHSTYDWYRAPLTLNGDAIGCLRFDHGYMRVTAETYSVSNSTEVLMTKQALVDADGNMLRLPADYNLVAYSDGVAVLEKNGRYGYYSYEGRWLTDPIYKKANSFIGSLGVAEDVNGKYHVFDTEGNEIIPGVFDYISDLSMGKMLCYKEGEGWILLTLYQKQVQSDGIEDTENTEEKKEENTVS